MDKYIFKTTKMFLFKIKLLFIFLIINSFKSLIGGKNNANYDQTTTCDDPKSFGFSRRPGTSEYYYIHDILLTWIDAEYLCKEKGAHLPSILEQSDLDYLRRKTFSLIIFKLSQKFIIKALLEIWLFLLLFTIIVAYILRILAIGSVDIYLYQVIHGNGLMVVYLLLCLGPLVSYLFINVI